MEERKIEYGVEAPFEPAFGDYTVCVYEDVPVSFEVPSGYMYAICEQKYHVPQPNEHDSSFIMLPYLMMFDPTISVWRTLNGSSSFLRIILSWMLDNGLRERLMSDHEDWIYFSLRNAEAAKNLN